MRAIMPCPIGTNPANVEDTNLFEQTTILTASLEDRPEQYLGRVTKPTAADGNFTGAGVRPMNRPVRPAQTNNSLTNLAPGHLF
jgi:hypothetical protein